MKKVIAVALALLCLFSCAYAETIISFKVRYNGSAKYFSAPEIGDYTKSDNIYMFRISDTFYITAQENGIGDITGFSVCCNSEDELTDFIFASISALSVRTQINPQFFGSLLIQIANVRNGKPNDPLLLPDMSGIIVKSTDSVKYMFILTNP